MCFCKGLGFIPRQFVAANLAAMAKGRGDTSASYALHAPSSDAADASASFKRGPVHLLSPTGIRNDGRLPHECRLNFLKTGAVTAAAGSAYAEIGQTKVIVSVFGPRESYKAEAFSGIGRLNCHVQFASFATPVRGKTNQASEEKEFPVMLHKALEGAVMLHTFPKTTVDIFALVLQSGGGDLPAVISCASMALADAGIAMYDLVPAVSACCVGKEILLDTTSEEEKWSDGEMLVTCMASRNEVTQLKVTGQWAGASAKEGLNLSLDACSKLAVLMRACLKEQAAGEEDDQDE